jgi:hypothetical protein
MRSEIKFLPLQFYFLLFYDFHFQDLKIAYKKKKKSESMNQ